MSAEAETVLSEIDSILETYRAGPGFHTACLACIERVAGRNSIYFAQAKRIVDESRLDHKTSMEGTSKRLRDTMNALRFDVEAGYLTNFREQIHVEVFADMLDSAQLLLLENTTGYKDAAAVLCGGVLEQHIKQLCEKYGVDTVKENNKGELVPKKFDELNQELAKAGVYPGTRRSALTSWYGIRTNAAHARYHEYDKRQVELFLDGLRDFIEKYPA